MSAIVVTHDSRGDIDACLRSLEQSTVPPDEIIVVDHASRDGTSAHVRREFPAAILLDYWDNPGFGEGNNRAFRVASGEYCFLLNPDATVAVDGIEQLLGTMKEDSALGAAAPKIRLAAEPAVLNSAGLAVNRIGYAWDRGFLEWDAGQYDRPEAVLGGSGCALLLRASVVRALGGFDPAFFLYYEDLDLCLRSWLAGRPVAYAPSALAWHAMKVHGRPLVYDEYLDHRNRLRTLVKTRSASSLVRCLPRLLAFEALSALDLARRRQGRGLALRLRAWGATLLALASTLRGRRIVQRRRVIADHALAGLFDRGAGAPRIKAALPDYPVVFEGGLDPVRLAPSLTMGRDEVGKLGLGWYGLEARDGVPYRWCCGYGILFLGAPARGWRGTLTVTGRSLGPTQVEVRIDRKAAGRWAVSPGPWQDYSLPVGARRDVVRIELLPFPSAVPAEEARGSRDHRVLGMAVARASLS
ncbi:MAG: glycosyltransferase [Candidatus Rokuibacteriota bacterium]